MNSLKKRKVGARSKYAKIPLRIKIKFLKKVINEGFSIRDVIIQKSSHRPYST
jgi:hypothetical protein